MHPAKAPVAVRAAAPLIKLLREKRATVFDSLMLYSSHSLAGSRDGVGEGCGAEPPEQEKPLLIGLFDDPTLGKPPINSDTLRISFELIRY